MKVSILVVFIVLPMLISIGLYTYAFISTRWSYLDENFITEHTSVQAKHYSPLESRMIRHGFRSFYGLFGYCMDYKWLHLLTMKSSNAIDEPTKPMNSSSNCPNCESPSASICPQTGCCMNTCDMMPDCPSYIDEKSCNRTYNQTRYYWPEANCIWYSTWITFEDLSLDLSSWMPTNMKRLRYLIMFSLFLAAPMFTVLALLILLCINCVERFYSIPFAFVSFFSFASFLSGSGALGLFLYEWIHERFYHQSTDAEAIILALNPWIIHAERLGLAFWILVAAIATNLFTAMLSCCFCCGLQSDKSKLRIHVKNDKYEIVHMSAYDD